MRYEIVEPLKELRIVSRAKFLRLANPRDWIDPVGLCHRVSDDDFVDVDANITFKGWGHARTAVSSNVPLPAEVDGTRATLETFLNASLMKANHRKLPSVANCPMSI